MDQLRQNQEQLVANCKKTQSDLRNKTQLLRSREEVLLSLSGGVYTVHVSREHDDIIVMTMMSSCSLNVCMYACIALSAICHCSDDQHTDICREGAGDKAD